MKIILDIKDPDAIIRDLRSVARVYAEHHRSAETSVPASPVSGRLLALAVIIESEAIAYRQAKDKAAQMLLGEFLPHSRACGFGEHEHGPVCHANCPSCRGEVITSWQGVMPGNDRCQICGEVGDHGGLPHGEVTGDGLTRDDVPLLEAPAPEEFADLTPRWSEDGGPA